MEYEPFLRQDHTAPAGILSDQGPEADAVKKIVGFIPL